jgi:hypothetical protein
MPRLTALIRPYTVAVVLAAVYCLWLVASDGPLALVTIGTQFDPGLSAETPGVSEDDITEGYDGQFVYYIARDPTTAATFIENGGDFAAYRFQRILLPALARVFAFGQTDWIPYALLLVNLVALGGGTALLERLLKHYGVSRWYALGYALSLGALGTVRLSLPETTAYALVIAALYVLILRDKPLWSAALFALAALSKETTLLFPAAVGVYLLFIQRRTLVALGFGVIALLPFIGWQVFLYSQFDVFGVGSGGAGTTGFTLIPFGGVIAIVVEAGRTVFGSINSGDLGLIDGLFRLTLAIVVFGIILVPFALVPTVWSLRRVWTRFRTGQAGSLLAWVLLFNAGIMLFVPFSTYREPLGILRFIIGLQIALILYAAANNHRRTLRYSTYFAITVIFAVASDFSA